MVRREVQIQVLSECSKKLVTQREMCERLSIDEATFSRLKKKTSGNRSGDGVSKY